MAARIHTSHSSTESPLWRGLWEYRFALRNLILKDFRVRYRNMSLGVLWSILNPLVMLGVLVIVFSYIHPQRHAHCFPVFVLLGMVHFNFFSLSTAASTGSIVDNAPLIKKLLFPREMMPISVVLSHMIHLAIQVVVLFGFVLAFRLPWRLTFLWLPVSLGVELLFTVGLALLCSALHVFFRDILYVVQSGLVVMFWFTPVFYDLGQVALNLPRPLYLLYLLNPLAGCIDASRRGILEGSAPDPESFGVAVAVTLLVFAAGYGVFRRRQRRFSDRI